MSEKNNLGKVDVAIRERIASLPLPPRLSRVSEKNFTIIELLVVVAIIGVLITLLLPALNKAKEMAKSSQCQSNLRQCGVALCGYAGDYDGWVIGGEANINYFSYGNLAALMVGLGYAPKTFSGTDLNNNGVRFGQVWQCPSLRTPAGSKVAGTILPYFGKDSKTFNSYGIRQIYYSRYFPGEKQASTGSDTTYRQAVKIASLYEPSQFPYIVDTCADASDSSGNSLGDYYQWHTWYIGSGVVGNGWGNGGALHLRHNHRVNVWMPDGHVDIFGKSDIAQLPFPGAGTIVTNYRIGYTP